jgi:molybdopterin/thiamine biosynthesis adenylyltransferase
MEKFFRNFPAISRSQQEKVRNSVFCVVGLGGTGGFALECLSRLGAERFVLFDHDRFELGNFNRQILATDGTVDMRKADVAADRLRSINPLAKMTKFSSFDKNRDDAGPNAISKSDVVLDCTDSIGTRLSVWESCQRRRIPYVFCSAEGSRGMVSVFSGYGFTKAFQSKGEKKERGCSSIVCPAAALAGTLAAAQALNMVIGKPAIRAPNALFFDIFDRRLFWKARLG